MKKTKFALFFGILAVACVVAMVMVISSVSHNNSLGGAFSGSKFNIYGSASNLTAVTSTSKTMVVGSAKDAINLNIYTSSTHAQTIAIVPEFSNDSDCSSATYFRQAINAATAGSVAVATSTYAMQVPVGQYRQNVRLENLNTECLKLSFTGSAAATTSMLWIEGQIK